MKRVEPLWLALGSKLGKIEEIILSCSSRVEKGNEIWKDMDKVAKVYIPDPAFVSLTAA